MQKYFYMLQDLINVIKSNKQEAILEKAAKSAKLQKTWYSGIDQESQIESYRTRETKPQKDQRNRVGVRRSKHVIAKVENIINQLEIMDKPSKNVFCQNEAYKKEIEDWIYNNNIAKIAFGYTKLYNIIDANSFVVCRVDENENVQFKVTESSNVWALKVTNSNIEYVIFRYERNLKTKKVYDFEMYTNEGYIIAEYHEGAKYEGERNGDHVFSQVLTNKMYAFRLGYKQNTETEFKTCDSILETSSELITSLIRVGTDFDVDLLTHGILQKSAYARRCNNAYLVEQTEHRCEGGIIYANGSPLSKCNSCNGTGLDIHTSSQDIILYPLPDDPNITMDLSKLSDIKFTPAANFDFKKKEIQELEQLIIDTIFSNTEVTKSETATNVTATQKVIDLQGVYSTLNQIGDQVSELFIWMCECKANIMGVTDAEFQHGYTLSLKLDNLETLAEKLKTLTDSGAPMEVISPVYLAMLEKQHIDSPQFLNRFMVWEKFRPFKNKRAEVITTILSGLPNTNRYKILYNFFDDIKSEIESELGDKFYDMKAEARKVEIEKQIDIIKAVLQEDEPQRMSFDNSNI